MLYIKLLFVFVLMLSVASAATYYVTDPDNCPSSDGTNFPGQNCAPQDICGDNGGIAQCYDTSTMSPPGSDSTTTGSGGTDYTCSDATCSGGFITNCYATVDSGAPYCDNNGAYLCDRNSTCYNKHVQTTCTGGSFALASCSATCTTNYFQCDGSTTDGDGCEIHAGDSCGSGTGTIVLNQCYSASAGNCTSSTRLDCNDDDSDGNSATCNGADGCEILIGGSCTVGSLTGTYTSVCTGSSGTCSVSKRAFVTGNKTEYQTNATEHFLWGVDYGSVGDLINFNNTNNGLWRVNASGCVIWMDGTATCSHPTGSGSGGGWQPNNATENRNYTTTGNVTANWFYGLFNWAVSDNWLSFNGSTLTFNATLLNNTIDQKLASITYNASLIINISGVTDAGNLASIQTAGDGDSYNVSEGSGANPLTIIINFTGVSDFNSLLLRIWYSAGTSAHQIAIGLYDYDSSTYEEEYGLISTMSSFEFKKVDVLDAADHISNGNVSLRLRHIQTGITSHDLFIDYAALVDGFSTVTNTEHDSLSGRNNILVNHPNIAQVFWNITQTYNITQIDDFNASWSSTYNATYNGLINNESYLSTYNATYNGLIGNVSYLNNMTNVAYTNQSQTFTGNQNFTTNITMQPNNFICGNPSCSQYIKFNVTGIFIQS